MHLLDGDGGKKQRATPVVIDAGLPSNREEWPDGVLDALKSFRQGTVFRSGPGLYWGDPNSAVHTQTASYAPDVAGACEFADPFPYGMVLSQTCDVVEEDAKAPRFPWVEVCPVYPTEWLPGDRRGHAVRGRVQYLIPVHPKSEQGDWVADLRLRVSVEKGWLAQQAAVDAFESDEGRRNVGKILAQQAERPAFDGRFFEGFQRPLVEKLTGIRASDADLFERLDEEIAEFGIRASDHVAMTDVEMHILLNVPVSPRVQDVLNELWETWDSSSRTLGFNLLPLQVTQLDQISALTYLSLTRVPLRSLSPDA